MLNVFFLHCLILMAVLWMPSKGYSNDAMALLTSTESDPDAIFGHVVNLYNGDYCESTTDLSIVGPDALLLQRFYNSSNYVTRGHPGGWRLFSQYFLVVGKDHEGKSSTIANESYEWTYAFSGERSGGILTYSGWTNSENYSKSFLKIDLLQDNIGAVNTYAKTLNGQNNYKNNQLQIKDETCEILLGDGTKRIYQKVEELPQLIFGEELIPSLAERVLKPIYYQLIQEILPSGNQLFFSYDSDGHLSYIELKNSTLNKTLSWIRFNYEFQNENCVVSVASSDKKSLSYHFKAFSKNGSKIYALTELVDRMLSHASIAID